MKYENKEAFEQVNMFGTGTPNTLKMPPDSTPSIASAGAPSLRRNAASI